MNNENPLILGIETSCDETGAALYQQGKGIISNALFSQIELHKSFGGVIPEIASRSQLEKIQSITKTALTMAEKTVDDLDTIAVTSRPGLSGSLLVGVCFAKAVAWAKNKKIIGINHLEGHAFSPCIENEVPFPHLCLTASGGHTSLFLVKNYGDYQIIGETQDDAAGEAFDKIAKLMNLGYPGGPIIEKLAAKVNFQDFFNYPRNKNNKIDFSFSGLKTAILYDLINKKAYDMKSKHFLKNDDILFQQQVCSSFLVCVGDIFIQKIEYALKQYPLIKAITFAGGVACNKYLQLQLHKTASKYSLPFFFPSAALCTDNAAMIAFVGSYKREYALFSDLTLDIF